MRAALIMRELRGLVHAHEQGEERHGLLLQAVGCLRGDVGELLALARGVEDGLARLKLGLRDVAGECHATAKEIEQLGVDLVDL